MQYQLSLLSNNQRVKVLIVSNLLLWLIKKQTLIKINVSWLNYQIKNKNDGKKERIMNTMYSIKFKESLLD